MAFEIWRGKQRPLGGILRLGVDILVSDQQHTPIRYVESGYAFDERPSTPDVSAIWPLRIGLTESDPRQIIGRSNERAAQIECDSSGKFLFFRIPPSTILYSKSRHSRAPLKSGMRLEAESRIILGSRMSALNRYAVQPVNRFLRTLPSLG